MDPATPSDEILDLIGAVSASNESRRKLHEFLAREREALQSHEPGGRHAANIAALELEIGKLRSADPAAARTGYSRRNRFFRRRSVRSVFGRRSP